VSTFAAGIVALGLALAIPDLIALSVNALFILLILLPAVVGGFFWKRSTAKGSLSSIIIGFAVTLLSLPFVPKVAFVPGFLASLVVFIVVSLLSSHEPSETLELGVAKS
jgi:SSS family solute:Na+ symporter